MNKSVHFQKTETKMKKKIMQILKFQVIKSKENHGQKVPSNLSGSTNMHANK